MDGEKNSYKTGPLGYLARCIFLSNWRASIPYSVTPQKMSHLAYMHFAACLADAEQGHSSLLWKWHTKQNDSGTCFCTICTILMVLGRKAVSLQLWTQNNIYFSLNYLLKGILSIQTWSLYVLVCLVCKWFILKVTELVQEIPSGGSHMPAR